MARTPRRPPSSSSSGLSSKILRCPASDPLVRSRKAQRTSLVQPCWDWSRQRGNLRRMSKKTSRTSSFRGNCRRRGSRRCELLRLQGRCGVAMRRLRWSDRAEERMYRWIRLWTTTHPPPVLSVLSFLPLLPIAPLLCLQHLPKRSSATTISSGKENWRNSSKTQLSSSARPSSVFPTQTSPAEYLRYCQGGPQRLGYCR
jgi:hypothetical protein